MRPRNANPPTDSARLPVATHRREITRLLFALMLLFLLVVLSASYWAIYGGEGVLEREDNARRVVAESQIVRGMIYSYDGEILARSEPAREEALSPLEGIAPVQQRRYEHAAAFSVVGYTSQRTGLGGAEAAYDDLLRGTSAAASRSWNAVLADTVLHRPQVGSDVRLTLNLALQEQLAAAMQGARGAAVLLDVPSGAVLAMISLPQYDPNTIDLDWERLAADANAPLFNRAVQGQYQPGTILQTSLLAAALLNGAALDTVYEDATTPVELDGVTAACALPLPIRALTLRDVYAFACPYPFTLEDDRVLAEATALLSQRALAPDLFAAPGFAASTPAAPLPSSLVEITAATDISREAQIVGQGEQRVSVLQMAMVAAGIINDGNAPVPYLLEAVRPPGVTEWQPGASQQPTIALMTTNTARLLQDAMRYTVAAGAAQNAGRPDLDVAGHTGIAFAGDEVLTWFIGTATFGGTRGAAIALVLEDVRDPGLAADIGGGVLLAVQQQNAQEQAGALAAVP